VAIDPTAAPASPFDQPRLIEWREFRIGVRVEKFAGIRKRRRFQVASVRLGLFHDNAVRNGTILLPLKSSCQKNTYRWYGKGAFFFLLPLLPPAKKSSCRGRHVRSV
jgi:hypothetical protein